jgi:competence protein ComEA
MVLTGGLLAIIGGASFISLRPSEIPVPERALDRQPIAVAVAGEVRKPGVYKLPWGARFQAAIDAAGGVTPRAETSLINPVQILTDGDQIRVPAKGVASTNTLNSKLVNASGERIDLNTATKEQIETLPGVGPKLAERLIQGRPYATLKDVDAIKGIGPSMLKKLEPLIRF